MRHLLILLCGFVSLRLSAATWYVDFDAGNDASAGTSTGAAWKTIPGTRNVGDTADQSGAWGSLTKVAAGDTIKIKSGTTFDSTDGGKILINSTWYSTSATLANPITIQRDTGWGSGSTVFDGSGMTLGGGGFGLIHIIISGVVIDGATSTNGFWIQDSPYCGVSAYPSGNIEGPSVYSCFFSNNLTSYNSVADDATEASLRLLRSYGGKIRDCYFDGNDHSAQAICFGESQKSCWNYTITNCVAWDYPGSDDGGIAFKGFNSILTFKNCVAYNCYKGFDLGEQNGNGSNITYKVINSTSRGHAYGVNFNCAGDVAYAGTVKFYLINSIIRDNTDYGSHIYAGPFDVHLTGNIFDNNGGTGFGEGNLSITSDNSVSGDASQVRAYLYNNIFYKPATGSDCNFIVQYYVNETNNFSLDSDYNSWTQLASEDVVLWAQLAGNPYNPSDNTTYAYGVNGIGRSSGNWYANYSYNTTPPASGTGHFHCDSHSVGTGATDTTAPPFTDVSVENYALTNSFSGTDLSGKPWYIAEMGLNADGTARKATPDMGPQDAPIMPDQPVVSTQRKAQTLNFRR